MSRAACWRRLWIVVPISLVAGTVSAEPDFSELQTLVDTMEPDTWHEVDTLSFAANAISQAEADAIDPRIWAQQGSSSIPDVWTGAAWAPQEGKLYFFGGGHNAYNGNEVYEIDVGRLTFTRLLDPAPLTLTDPGIGDPYPETGPAATHTYDGFVHAAPLGKLYVWGAFAGASADQGSQVAEFDLSSNAWSWLGDWSLENFPGLTAYDSTRGVVHGMTSYGITKFVTFDVATKEYTRWQEGECWAGSGVMVYDAPRDVLVAFLHCTDTWGSWPHPVGNAVFELDPDTYAMTTLSGPGSTPSSDDVASGLALRGDRIYLWDGTSRIDVLDRTSGQWMNFEPASGPPGPSPSDGGVYSKWVYVPQVDVFAGLLRRGRGLWIYKPADSIDDDLAPAAPTNLEAE